MPPSKPFWQTMPCATLGFASTDPKIILRPATVAAALPAVRLWASLWKTAIKQSIFQLLIEWKLLR